MNLNTLSHTEAVEQVTSVLLDTGAVVMNMDGNAVGYPDLMVLVKDCMPIFLFVRPDPVSYEAAGAFQFCKRIVTEQLAEVNAVWFDVQELSDMDWMMGEILNRTKGGEMKRESEQHTTPAVQTALEFGPVEASDGPVATDAPKTVRARRGGPAIAVETDKRKAWLS